MQAQTAITIETTFFPWADEVLLNNWDYKYKIVAKGRRLGFTRSTAMWLILQMFGDNDTGIWNVKKEGQGLYILWGDTTHANIRKYYERYFKPLLQQYERKIKAKAKNAKLFEYKKQDNTLIVYRRHNPRNEQDSIYSVIDFRSADKPENWEGFGYDIVVLNEAGIILKNRSLWEHSVAPMMLDNPLSKAIIGGVPKGKNLFYELWQRGNSADYPSWKSYRYTTYDNPLLSEEDIEELKKGLTENAIRQEIYGEFVEATDQLFTYEEVEQAMRIQTAPEIGLVVWGLDIARHGDDLSVLAKRKGKRFYEPLKTFDIQDTMKLAEHIVYEYNQSPKDYKPDVIFIDTTGGSLGWGVYDRLKQFGLPVEPVNFAEKSAVKGLLNKRIEMYERLKENHIKQGGNLPKDNELLFELINTEYEYTNKGLKKLVPKEKIKETIGRSPDRADAVALTYAYPVEDTLIKKRKSKAVKKKFTAGV